MGEAEKVDYMTWLKEEIAYEDQSEKKFKGLENDLSLMQKNYLLEQELHRSEHETKKLQIWIMEDKYEALIKTFEQARNDREVTRQAVDETKTLI